MSLRRNRVSRSWSSTRKSAHKMIFDVLEDRLALAGVDLQGYDTYAPASAQWGQAISVITAIRNAGTSTSGAFQLQWYLSRDSVGSSNDLLLSRTAGAGTSFSHAALAGNTIEPDFTVNLQLPSAPPSGWTGTSFHVILRTDSANQVVETNENNNFGQVGIGYDRDPITINPAPPQIDLQGYKTYATDTAQWGQAISVNTAIRNAGPSPSGAFQLQWYLSQDTTGTAGLPDVLLPLTSGATSYNHATLAGNSTGSDFTINLQLPANPPAGWTGTGFHVILRTDSASQVVETNENNNFGQVGKTYDRDSITINPAPPQIDLQGYKTYATDTAQWGQAISVNTAIRNAGPSPSGAFQLQWYLSQDTTGTAGLPDVLLPLTSGATSYNHATLAGNSTGSDFTINLQLPANPPSGWTGTSFHVILRTDSASQVVETNENNNFGQIGSTYDRDSITINPAPPQVDLQSYYFNATDTAQWGQAISVITAIRNAGPSPSGAFQLQWYLSQDAISTAGFPDVLLPLTGGATSYNHGALAGNTIGPDFTVNLQLPANPPAGWTGTSFYVILRIDSANQVVETNENNNTASDSITFPSPSSVDLVISSGTPTVTPTTVAAGGTVALSAWTVKNQGTGASGAFSNGFYLSTDTAITASDTFLTGNSNTSLAGGAQFSWGAPTLTIPTTTAAGTYYVGILVDNAGQVAESNEGNNYVSVPITVTDPTFLLHSRPGGTKRIYLDFDGDSYTGPWWNSGVTVVTPQFSLDADTATFTAAELARIRAIWERVAEDFRPFDVDVTTQFPGLEALRKVGAGDTEWGIRVVIGGNGSWFGSAGGVAYIGSFNWDTDTPAYVFPGQLGNGDEKFVAEATSHEAGHALGLVHDGRTSPVEAYYAGQGTGATGWAPIMGNGYSRPLTQWSKGEYANANNTEDDLARITTQNGFGYRADDHVGTTLTTADPLILSGPSGLSGSGIIERNTDIDTFSFTTSAAGSVALNVNPFYRGPNLDILAQLYNAAGTLLQSSNPIGALNATINLTLAAGTYLLRIDGVGEGSPTATGYSDYGSLGSYSITGTASGGAIFQGATGLIQSLASTLASWDSGIAADAVASSPTSQVPVTGHLSPTGVPEADPGPLPESNLSLFRNRLATLGGSGRSTVDLTALAPFVDQALESWAESPVARSKTKGRKGQRV